MYDNGLLKGEGEYHRFSITNRLPKKVLKPSLYIHDFHVWACQPVCKFATIVVVCKYGIDYETRVMTQLKVEI